MTSPPFSASIPQQEMEDNKKAPRPVLEHRLVLQSGARFSGATAASVLEDVLSQTAVPAADMPGHVG